MRIPHGFTPVLLGEMLISFPPLGDMLLEHLGMSQTEAAIQIADLERRGLAQFAVGPQGDPAVFIAAAIDQESEKDRTLAEKLVSFWDVTGKFNSQTGFMVSADPFKVEFKADPPKLPPSHVPHWQEAIDYRFKAIDELKIIEKLSPNHPKMGEIIWADMLEDLAALRGADTYSFSAETMHAIMTGAKSIPHESTLQSVEVPPTRAGWFWFAEPYPVACSPLTSDAASALLWWWDTREENGPTLRFSLYTVDTKTARRGQILPSTKWLWPLDFSFHEMIGLNTQMYRNAYGPGGPYEGKPHLSGENETLKVVGEMSLFFLMSCVWFRQTVPGTKKKIDPKLTQEPGHIERHARKRYQREHKLAEPPTVRVVALRKTAAQPVEHTESEATRHLTVRFVVSGHPRLQPCGPGRTDKKLIWIDPYPKGPADAPFKESSSTKVFAVIR